MPVMKLRSLASRSIVLAVLPDAFGNTDFGPVDRLREDVHSLPVGANLHQELWHATTYAMEQVISWWHRHSALFKDQMATRCGHLLLYIHCLRWHDKWIEVDDRQSAEVIIKENENWPQLQFQLACAYAIVPLISSFDSIRLRVFHRRLSGHPLYDFWLTYLEKGEELFNQRGIVPKQPTAAVFSWATTNGFLELVRFLWAKLPPAQSEYLTVMLWNRLCRRAEHGPVFGFLCTELCRVNDTNVARITVQCFLHAANRLTDDDCKEDAERQVTFLLQYGCPMLRQTLFESDNFRVMLVTLRARNERLFRLLKQCVSIDQLLHALHCLKTALEPRQWQAVHAALSRPSGNSKA